MAFKFDWEKTITEGPIKTTGSFQFDWEKQPVLKIEEPKQTTELTPTPYSPEEQFGKILGTVGGKPAPMRPTPERPFMEEYPTLYGVGKAIETLPQGIKELGEAVVSGATLGLSDQAK